MSFRQEELTALALMDPEDILKEIREKEKLRDQMVGGLYPGIVQGEIDQLKRVYRQRTGTQL